MPKENIEIFAAGKIGVIKDFQEGAIHKNGKIKSHGTRQAGALRI